MVRQYIGARYIPKFVGAWDNTTVYEALSIVEYNNSSYTSKKPVPAGMGNPATATEYWALSGNTSGQIDEILTRLGEAEDNIDDLGDDVESIKKKYNGRKFLILGDSLSDEGYTPIQPNWVVSFRERVEECGGSVTNYSNSGRTLSAVRTDNLIAHLGDIPAGNYTDVILFLGVNDWADSATFEQMTTACNSFQTWVNNNHITTRVWVITPLNSVKSANGNIPECFYRDILCKYSEAYGWTVIDGFLCAPNFRGNITAQKNKWSTDGVHINSDYAPIFAKFVEDSVDSNGCVGDNNYTMAIDFLWGSYHLYAYYQAGGNVQLYCDFTGYTPTTAVVKLGTIPSWLRGYTPETFYCYAAASGGLHPVTMTLKTNGDLYAVFDVLNVEYGDFTLNEYIRTKNATYDVA